jgi:hypothetical protein
MRLKEIDGAMNEEWGLEICFIKRHSHNETGKAACRGVAQAQSEQIYRRRPDFEWGWRVK